MILNYKVNTIDGLVYLKKCDFVKEYLIEHSLDYIVQHGLYRVDYKKLKQCFFDEILIGDLVIIDKSFDVWKTNGQIFTVKEKFISEKFSSECVRFLEKSPEQIENKGIYIGYLQFEPNFYKNKMRLKKLNQVFNK